MKERRHVKVVTIKEKKKKKKSNYTYKKGECKGFSNNRICVDRYADKLSD